MKNIKIILLPVLLFSIVMVSCEDWVQDLPPREDIIEDDVLVDEADIDLLVLGIKTNFSSTIERSSLYSEILGDAVINGRYVCQDATYDVWRELEEGDIQLNNAAVDGLSTNIGEMWHCATNLVDRITNRMGEISEEKKNYGLFNGHLFEGIAYEIYANYYGLNEEEGGGCINSGPFTNSGQLFDMALNKYEEALNFTSDPWEIRVVNSLMARCYLYKGDYSGSRICGALGLTEGDQPFEALYVQSSDNYWWQQASIGLRVQVIVDNRFAQYIDEDPNEANRIPLYELPDELNVSEDTAAVYWTQGKYIEADAPIAFITWQETYLILAELAAIRGQSGNALDAVNAVRGSHGIDPVSEVNRDLIITERDKELFTTGARLIDQRRFDLWHLPSGTWKYLPITESERNANDNLPNVGE
ncbi:MAG: RagB/SusD family nutrient uptake outer membrane protein [Candidatus Marinimicrobia bacterium]|nr:RagB/SusD family nutrient uptake outer membrane protein [Candidatus Neomarinimicrobiota bacterium]